ncbi:MAG: RNA polymerase sigma-70 factor [Lentimicrobium sp.]|nr:RNA polymerase sigma-70 factor [Lentimicrobium sp.]
MINSEDRFTQGLKNGDEKVFEELFKAYYTPLCDYCLRYVSDADMAEEIVQDLFFKMWVKREELNINVSIKSYFYISLRNHALNYINRLKIQDRYNQFVEIRTRNDVDYPIDVLEEKDMERIMKQAIAMLPEKRREIFEMSRFEDMKYSEIAEKLNVSVKTVESQMSKALEHMRKVLSKFLALIVTGLFLLRFMP